MNDTVMVRLNKRRLIETFRFAYPNRYTVLAELLQNARRAGALVVHVRYDADAKRLTVADDGCGVSDFQTLLTLGESGWSEAVRRTEQPFGLGFLFLWWAPPWQSQVALMVTRQPQINRKFHGCFHHFR